MPASSRSPVGVVNSRLRERDVRSRQTGLPSRNANVGYACLQQRPTSILLPPRCTKIAAAECGKSGKSLQTPT